MRLPRAIFYYTRVSSHAEGITTPMSCPSKDGNAKPVKLKFPSTSMQDAQTSVHGVAQRAPTRGFKTPPHRWRRDLPLARIRSYGRTVVQTWQCSKPFVSTNSRGETATCHVLRQSRGEVQLSLAHEAHREVTSANAQGHAAPTR